MKRWLPLLAVVLLAATAEENRLYQVARGTFKDKLYDVAERQFAEFQSRFPQSERADGAQLFLAQAQLNQGKWEVAVSNLTVGISRWPEKKPDVFRFWLGEGLARGGKFAEAEGRYREVAEKFEKSEYHAQAMYGLAFALVKLGRFAEAIEWLDKLVKLVPKSDLKLDADVLRGEALLGVGQLDAADAVLDAAAKSAPGTRQFFLAQRWLGESMARRHRGAEALAKEALVTQSFQSKPGQPVDAQLVAEAWFTTGWVQWEGKDFAAAATSFSATLTNAQTTALKRDALLKVAEALVRAGQVSEGVVRLRSFLEANPQDPIADEVQLAIADLLFKSNETEKAFTEYVRLVETYPRSAQLGVASFHAGACAWQLKLMEPALKYFQQAAKLMRDPKMAAEALCKVGDAQFALGQYREAAETYASLTGGGSPVEGLDRVLFQLGEARQKMRDAGQAVAAFESLVKQFPQSSLAPEAQFTVGQIQLGAGHPAEARAAFGKVREVYATSVWAPKAALAVGECYESEGKLTEAVSAYEKLIAEGKDTALGEKAFYNRGYCQARLGKPEKTLADYTLFIKEHPRSELTPDMLFWIGELSFNKRDYLKAQEQFQSLVSVYPSNLLADSAQYLAGRSAYARQDYKGAVALFEALLKNYPQSSLRCDARFAQGDALSELQRFDDALLVFDALLKEFPECGLSCEALGRKGDCQFTLTRYDDALASYRKALECAKDSSLKNQVLYKIGQCWEKKGKLDEAISFYTQPIYADAGTNEPPERFWAGKAGRAAAGVKEQQQQWQDAMTLYEKLAQRCPDLKTLSEERVRKIRVDHVILY